ncbi:nitroreductase family protein [Candidatus Woesearchaeota archaeon]|jgi:nitroreductase|nr:nitroreductase family protein [Candidatus Woesearchaeota archaeon]MBT4111167.1 nitroreductase family protein [Candidatus Woesearchaeota archaeon]MBT4336748.1 nitroreductase family protein [Candidatus Woesearchaeota archaeon]MBT4469416.1 nitroreductase family protein [Candidatus Woesearchaeota archaeon]MBT6744189.1 nitroreductase family protein [Candidatus Woesearchaeota archaeon]
MGDILDLIKNRRTIKTFMPKYVSWEKISRIIDAGRHAPSCGNVQNWKFLLVSDPDQKQQVAEAAYKQYEIIQAGTLIIVCGEPEKAERYYGLRGERLYSVQNCAAAIQNMLLEAESLGLGTRWIGGFDEEALKTMFKIPPDVRPQAIIAIGYPKEVPPKPPKYPLETVVYFGSWRLRLRDPAKYMNDTATILARKANATKVSLQKVSSSVVDKVKEKLNLER